MPQLAARFVLLILLCWSPLASAQITRVQPPAKNATSAKRAVKVRRARAQAIKPEQARRLAASMDRRAAALGEAGLGDPQLRGALSTAPLAARLEVFVKAAARRGITVQLFERRLRGMLKVGKKNRVVSPKKTFFEVTPETFDLFPKIMGENVIWFAASASPGHLHTLLADQDGGPIFTHNTYGEGTLTEASIGSLEQYAAPAQLTGAEMDRFVRYLNAGVAHDREAVYGFRTSSGQLVCPTKCTNWATSAPIGDLERWVRTVDRRVARPSKYRDGLHALLARAGGAEARAAIIAEVTGSDALTPHAKASARRLGKQFDFIAEKWPQRPLDLVGRKSLAETLGVARSQDPAKWMYDLFMSKRVPVIGVLTKNSQAEFARKTFDLEIMGDIDAAGDVVGNSSGSGGVVPAERRRQPAQPAEQPAQPADQPEAPSAP